MLFERSILKASLSQYMSTIAKSGFYVAVDQMPLTLHRQFSLMRELDQQSHGALDCIIFTPFQTQFLLGYVADLLPTFHKYVARRMAMAQPNPVVEEVSTESVRPNNIPKQERLSTPPAVFSIDIPIGISPSKLGPSTPLRKLRADSTPATPMGIPPERVKPPQTTREMLSHIAWLSEELLRTSEEKVNLAQAAYDSVRLYYPSLPLISSDTQLKRLTDTYDSSTRRLKNRKPRYLSEYVLEHTWRRLSFPTLFLHLRELDDLPASL